MKVSPFDHRPDRELGKALRAILSSEDDAAFASRVVARMADSTVGRVPVDEWWEVLNLWARPGLVAAAIGLAAAVTILLGGVSGSPASVAVLGDPLEVAGETVIPPAFLATTQPPDLNELLAFALAGQ